MSPSKTTVCLSCVLLCPPLKIPRNASLGKEQLRIIHLGMMPDSVDDMLFGCSPATMIEVERKFSAHESKEFAEAWGRAKECARSRLPNGLKTGLTEKQLEAICLYTGNQVYQDFNTAVRSQRKDYGSKFKFHHLYVFLTSAVQTLKQQQPCLTSYRRSDIQFIGKDGERIRFGSFASSSKRTDRINFGTKTCFQIKTCDGAFLGDFSVYPDEEEVLIPPYEVFKIIKVQPAGLKNCEVLFVLESSGCKSEMNCKLVI